MKERPILFNSEMVRAVLDDRKTQTRRVCVGQRELSRAADFQLSRCPYGQPGDRLWVKETWRVGTPSDDKKPKAILPSLVARGKGITVLYEAGGWKSVGPVGRKEPAYANDEPMPKWAGKCRPSIFMPREFSRITLEIESVRVQRVQEITADDCRAEGIGDDFNDVGARYCFGQLWNSINEPRSLGWDVNPWVWAITFRRVK